MFFFFQAEDGIRDLTVTGVQTCALPIWGAACVMGRRRSRHAPSANHPASVRPGVVAPGGRANASVKAASITERSTGSPDRGMSPTTRAAAWLERCLVRVRCADRPLTQRHAEHEGTAGAS